VPTYRLTISYDGTDFHGYAVQPNVRTVQGELEKALRHHTGGVETHVAGRTDAGVHAIGQVVSFTTATDLDADRVRRSLNRQLGPEIAVLMAGAAPDDFHARFSATGRSYRYTILNREVPNPFRARTSWHVPDPLDLAAMNAAAAAFVGEHDFASFCRKADDTATVRRVDWAAWRRADTTVVFDVAASSFCHQMVRSLVAQCVDVGRGRVEATSIPAVMAARNRNASRGAAPPHGLSLVAVAYPGEPLPAPESLPVL
jgi:tRNA pseudouridine38-40 synthase